MSTEFFRLLDEIDQLLKGTNMYHRTSTSTYRHRGYHCPVCKVAIHVFGNDPAPVTCGEKDCTGQLVKDWDHTVQQDTVVRDFATGTILK